MILFSESSSNSLLVRVMSKLFGWQMNFQSRIPCENNTGCLNSQICESKKCIDPCPGKCGTNALCNVNNHNLNCSCARCYEGDPQKICTQFPGLEYWTCQLWE
ncbi:hypothetical protein PV325_013288 [Microctonus aethiopoides]|uniref:EGF-like domain-containing protein n=1 Tax=Microctonus aethiopoides TaxID=144406 RepID=A0AA39KSV1_9HYME|nr:hypothetical protein PV325_013288 [Microctonus aethiopoides]KAK0172479.1 hypothetical protein PV328_005791 [Microctonus aethiopoides]